MKTEETITDEQYVGVMMHTAETLRILLEQGRHPTAFIVDVIREVYGHNVELKDLIQLIETSPLEKKEKW